MALARDRCIATAATVTGAATTGVAIVGCAWAVAAARTYHFRAAIPYTVAATTTGVSLSIVPQVVTTAATFFSSMLTGKSAVGTIQGGGVAVYAAAGATAGAAGVPTAITDTAQTAGGLVFLEGFVTPAVAQVLQLEIIPEAAAAVSTIPGAYLEWELVI